MTEWLLYGATGYTGSLLARACIQRGLSPTLGGRNVSKLAQLARTLGLAYRVASLQDAAALDRALSGMRLVLHAAGPFERTAPPLIEACLRNRVHYLDISGETAAIENAAQSHAQALASGVMVLPGVGFDVVPSDCLAMRAASRVREPTRLSIAISGLSLLSRGSAHTIIDQLSRPVWVRRGGQITPLPHGSLEQCFDFGRGEMPALVTSWGDVASAYYSTGIADITTFFEATPPVRFHTSLMRTYGRLVPLTGWQAWLHGLAGLAPSGPSERTRARHRATIVAVAENDRGERAVSRMHTPEAYTMTVSCALEIARRVAGGDAEPGFQTPARLLGPNFAATMAGVAQEDL